VKSKERDYNVSASQWDKSVATTLCNSLSPAYQKGVPYATVATEDHRLDLKLTIKCDGREQSIGECALTADRIQTNKYASVVCYDKFCRYCCVMFGETITCILSVLAVISGTLNKTERLSPLGPGSWKVALSLFDNV
jgi:hypothetical protein